MPKVVRLLGVCRIESQNRYSRLKNSLSEFGFFLRVHAANRIKCDRVFSPAVHPERRIDAQIGGLQCGSEGMPVYGVPGEARLLRRVHDRATDSPSEHFPGT
jgi:hypothetical protein